jgi:hypothetical protein
MHPAGIDTLSPFLPQSGGWSSSFKAALLGVIQLSLSWLLSCRWLSPTGAPLYEMYLGKCFRLVSEEFLRSQILLLIMVPVFLPMEPRWLRLNIL